MTQKPGNFTKYIGTRYEHWILPIIPVGATLKLRADGTTIDPSNLGKIPGKRLANGEWVGFIQWSVHQANERDLREWQLWHDEDPRVAVCINTEMTPAVDADINRQDDADEVWGIICRVLGLGALRTRSNSPRFTCFFRWEGGTPPVHKRAKSWFDDQGDKHGIDILGVGCETLIDGLHKSGALLEWPLGDLIDREGQLPLVDAGKMAELLHEIDAWIERKGYKPNRPSLSDFAGREDLVTYKIDPNSDILSPLAVGPEDFGQLAGCVRAIDLDHPDLVEYDTWLSLLRAVKAACSGSDAFFAEVVWPWSCTQKEAHGQGGRNEEQGVGWLQERWNSFSTSGIGYDHVLHWANTCGYAPAADLLRERNHKAREIFGAPTDAGDDAAGAGAATAGLEGPEAAGAGQGTGPTPVGWTDEALADLFAAERPEWRYAEDQGWVVLENGVYVPRKTVIRPIMRLCSVVGDVHRSRGGAVGEKIDILLKGIKKTEQIERTLRAHPTVFACAKDFDAEPWLLNTPTFIIDLRNGERHSHGMLMRQQTAVTPDFGSFNAAEQDCPRFLAALRDMTEDEHDVQLLLRHAAAGLVGMTVEQLLLFIFGVGGTGKSTLSDILLRMESTYATVGSSAMFQKQADKRNYELGGIVGRRALFVPETLKGMTWDEILVCEMLGGVEISAERKHVQPFKFRNAATITVTGNHRPKFITNAGENRSGIDRRLMLLKVDKVIPPEKRDVAFAEKIVAAEGPAIMMLLVQTAMDGYASMQRTGSFYGETKDKALAAAKAYKATLNPHSQWIEELDLVLDPSGQMNAAEAFRSYKAWAIEENPTFRETKAEFREAMEAIRVDDKSFVRYHRFDSERVFIGLRYAGTQSGGNVISLAQKLGRAKSEI